MLHSFSHNEAFNCSIVKKTENWSMISYHRVNSTTASNINLISQNVVQQSSAAFSNTNGNGYSGKQKI